MHCLHALTGPWKFRKGKRLKILLDYLQHQVATDRMLESARSADRPCAINITAALIINTTQLPDAVLGSPYSQAIAVTGGTPPYALLAGTAFAGTAVG